MQKFMETLKSNTGSCMPSSSAKQTNAAVECIRNAIEVVKQNTSETPQKQAQIDRLETGLKAVEKIGKQPVIPSSPAKGLIIGKSSMPKKLKRGFLYLVYQFLEGGILCPYLKIGYIKMDVTDDVWEKLRKTLTRYGTNYNQFFFYFVPIATCVQQLGSKVENWILRAFSDTKYCPTSNTFNDMKEGAVKSVIGTYINEDATQYYAIRGTKKKNPSIKVILIIVSIFSKIVSHKHNSTLLSRKLLKTY